jgi:multiple antibiotic resistance protein
MLTEFFDFIPRASIHFVGMSFVSLFTTLNPVGATAFFLSNPETLESEIYRKKIAKRGAMAAFLILLIFALCGQLVFRIMGVTISSFQIAGGIFVFTVAFDMLKGRNVRTKTLPEERIEAAHKDDISITPLATPLLAGPGTITITILTMAKATTLVQKGFVLVILFLICLLTYWILLNSVKLLRYIGEGGVRVMNRVMGLFVASIAVQMFLTGLLTVLGKK